jgi:hypothetical protein
MAVKGTFGDITFVELMQLVHLTQKTGRLEVSLPDGRWAMIIFREGVVWHVEPRGFKGATPEEVIFMLVGMEEGNFVLQRIQVLPALERTVNLSTEALIMEGTKRIDDESALAQEMGEEQTKLKHVLRLKPGAEAKVRYVPQSVKRVLLVIDGKRTVSEVIRDCQLEQSQATKIIKDLVDQGILEASEPEQPAPVP